MPRARFRTLNAGPVRFLALLFLFVTSTVHSVIPATPVMTRCRFNGDLDMPYVHVDALERSGSTAPAGTLAQGTRLTPCFVIRHGRPLTDRSGTPFVGFDIEAEPWDRHQEGTLGQASRGAWGTLAWGEPPAQASRGAQVTACGDSARCRVIEEAVRWCRWQT